MSTTGQLILQSINALNKYKYQSNKYFNIKDLMSIKAYSKGCNASQDRLIRTKKFSSDSCIQGRIALDDLSIHIDSVISKKYTKKFVKTDEVLKEFQSNDSEVENNSQEQRADWLIYDERPLIKPLDNDMYMFKDNKDISYSVEMRGDRTKDGIIFKCKDIAKVFEMPNLYRNLVESTHNNSSFEYKNDFLYVKTPHGLDSTNKELYLTFNGLQKVIRNSRTGRAKDFIDWLNDIVFAAMFGTEEQRRQSAASVLNITTRAIIKALSKCSGDISCLYLLSTRIKENDKKVYKFGRTKHLDTRIKQHITTFGENLKLVKYCIIADSDLVEAESMFKERAEDFKYESKEEKYKNMTELIIMNKKEKEYMLERMLNISSKFKFDSKETIDSIQRLANFEVEKANQKIYIIEVEHKAKLEKAKQEYEMLLKDLENEKKLREMTQQLHEMEISMKNNVISSKDKDIIILEQKLELASLKNN